MSRRGEQKPINRQEFERLYAECAEPLERFLRRQVSEPQRAADLVQEAFVRLLRKKPQTRDSLQLKGYLYKTAANLATDHRRRENREKLWFLPLRRVPASRVERFDLHRLFAALNPQERALLWLAHVEDLTHEEIGQALELKRASVKVLLFRARRRFAAKLKAAGLDPEAMP